MDDSHVGAIRAADGSRWVVKRHALVCGKISLLQEAAQLGIGECLSSGSPISQGLIDSLPVAGVQRFLVSGGTFDKKSAMMGLVQVVKPRQLCDIWLSEVMYRFSD